MNGRASSRSSSSRCASSASCSLRDAHSSVSCSDSLDPDTTAPLAEPMRRRRLWRAPDMGVMGTLLLDTPMTRPWASHTVVTGLGPPWSLSLSELWMRTDLLSSSLAWESACAVVFMTCPQRNSTR